jgi:hypothetical protein
MRTGIIVAVSAAIMSIVWQLFSSYGYPWPSLGWLFLACAAGAWAATRGDRASRSMSDVIRDVEAESGRVPAALKRGVA